MTYEIHSWENLVKRLLRHSAVLAALTLTAPACGRGKAPNPFASPASRDGKVSVRVENQNFGDATVHAVRGGERIRLGEVVGKMEGNFDLRWNFSLPMEFEIHITGGLGCRVRALSVDPGDRVWVRIPPEISVQPCYSGKN